MSWLSRHAASVEALAATVTAAVAVAALIGVKYQLDTAERLQQTQAAKEIYREFLTLSIQNPDLMAPGVCPKFSPEREVSYGAYVEHLLYTAEEAVVLDENLNSVFAGVLENHATYLCQTGDWSAFSAKVVTLISETRARECATLPVCVGN